MTRELLVACNCRNVICRIETKECIRISDQAAQKGDSDENYRNCEMVQ